MCNAIKTSILFSFWLAAGFGCSTAWEEPKGRAAGDKGVSSPKPETKQKIISETNLPQLAKAGESRGQEKTDPTAAKEPPPAPASKKGASVQKKGENQSTTTGSGPGKETRFVLEEWGPVIKKNVGNKADFFAGQKAEVPLVFTFGPYRALRGNKLHYWLEVFLEAEGHFYLAEDDVHDLIGFLKKCKSIKRNPPEAMVESDQVFAVWQGKFTIYLNRENVWREWPVKTRRDSFDQDPKNRLDLDRWIQGLQEGLQSLNEFKKLKLQVEF